MSANSKREAKNSNNAAQDAIRIQLYISEESNPELFALFKTSGRYYRAKRLAQLAMTGLALENGRYPTGLIASTGQPVDQPVEAKTEATPPGKPKEKVVKQQIAQKSQQEEKMYHITESTSQSIGELFDDIKF